MYKFNPVYLIVMHQGNYDEYRKINLCAYRNSDLATRHAFRLQTSFVYLHDFYKEELRCIRRKYPDIMQAPDVVFEKYHIFSAKVNKFEGAVFNVEQIEIRRFHR